MTISLGQFGLEQLDATQRIELMGLIWNSLEDEPLQPPAWHREVLEKRLQDTEGSKPENMISLTEVKARLLK